MTNDWSVRKGYRKAGEALFPELKPLDFLQERRKLSTTWAFAAPAYAALTMAGRSGLNARTWSK
jgi:hypothetical protein